MAEHRILAEKYMASKGYKAESSQEVAGKYLIFKAVNKVGKKARFVLGKFEASAQTETKEYDLTDDFREFLLSNEPNYRPALSKHISQQMEAAKRVWATPYENETPEEYLKRRKHFEKIIKQFTMEMLYVEIGLGGDNPKGTGLKID